MALRHRSVMSNEVRVPEVPRGEVVLVARYREDRPKVALVNPDDLAMFEASHELIQSIGTLEALPVDHLTLKTRAVEDRPDPEGSIEDPEAINALLER